MHLVPIVNYLAKHDEFDVARSLLDTFAKRAVTPEQFDELAMLYTEIKDYSRSLELLHVCLNLTGDKTFIYNIRANMAKCYNHVNDPQKAIEYCLLNKEEIPDNYETDMEMSFSYYLMGNKEKSFEIQQELLTKDISLDLKERIMYNMGTYLMHSGRFKDGIRNMIRGGRGLGIWPYYEKPYPKWDGEYTDKTLLVYGEAGIGDEIINVRFLNELKKRNIKAIWIGIRKDLCEVFNKNGLKAIHTDKSLDPFEDYVYIEAMSLPIYLELEKDQLWDGPYLKPDQQYIDKWKKILPEKFLTVKWKGNPYYEQDLHRFLDINVMLDVFGNYDIPIISIQLEEPIEDPRLTNVKIENWQDTLAIQYLATFNLTSCTSTAHSSSAMGANTIVFTPIATYYPWINKRDEKHSFWYGENTYLFEQKEHKNWLDPIKQAAKFLEENIL